MKKILKYIVLFTFSLLTSNQIWQNLSFEQIPLTIVKVAVILTIFELLLKPIIKILLIPINILTLGLFRMVIDALGLYLAVFFLSDFQVGNIYISQYNYHVNNFWAYLLSSFTIGTILYIYNLILRKSKPKK
ncbi:MAG: phage holin family protein [Candidatus Shapirobacteria bacterium]|jgi:putative membrane protein|nr:phage holin family protein [Candidatus Shapirobacteria bacterium]